MQSVPLDAEIAVIAASIAAFAAWLVTRSSDPERAGWGVRVYCMAFSLCSGAAISTPLQDDKSQYRVYEWKDDPRFITSITRLFGCNIPGSPSKELRIPWETYPRESLEHHEEGKVVMQLIFDPDWCVRKATILQSSGYYHLDNVSLEFAMMVKYSFNVVKRVDGEPTITFPIVWCQRPCRKTDRHKGLPSPPDQPEWTQ